MARASTRAGSSPANSSSTSSRSRCASRRAAPARVRASGSDRRGGRSRISGTSPRVRKSDALVASTARLRISRTRKDRASRSRGAASPPAICRAACTSARRVWARSRSVRRSLMARARVDEAWAYDSASDSADRTSPAGPGTRPASSGIAICILSRDGAGRSSSTVRPFSVSRPKTLRRARTVHSFTVWRGGRTSSACCRIKSSRVRSRMQVSVSRTPSPFRATAPKAGTPLRLSPWFRAAISSTWGRSRLLYWNTRGTAAGSSCCARKWVLSSLKLQMFSCQRSVAEFATKTTPSEPFSTARRDTM